ncbi:MAG: GHKL domain-containing protein, partial [Proteobacteria bacterium]|nr:GHKL domain-containing protein [Pseudomonadota bacterium]
GWLAALLSIVAVEYAFAYPIGIFGLGIKDLPWLTAFAIYATVANILSSHRRRMVAQLLQMHAELERRVDERTADLRRSNNQLIRATAKRVRAEVELRKSQVELGRIGRIITVGEFTASIAHEINQPLGAIVANGAAARNWLQRNPPEFSEIAKSVDAMIAAGERAAEVINKIRSLVSEEPSELKTMDVNELVGSVFELTQLGFRKAEIKISFQFEPGLPPIRGDRVQLQHVFLNLLNNAVEAMSDLMANTAELLIRTEHSPGNRVSIVFEDCGSGFVDADITRIFEPFYSTKKNGMGMGLSICRTIVKLHGGRINVSQRSPRGVAFRVILPAGAPS